MAAIEELAVIYNSSLSSQPSTTSSQEHLIEVSWCFIHEFFVLLFAKIVFFLGLLGWKFMGFGSRYCLFN